MIMPPHTHISSLFQRKCFHRWIIIGPVQLPPKGMIQFKGKKICSGSYVADGHVGLVKASVALCGLQWYGSQTMSITDLIPK